MNGRINSISNMYLRSSCGDFFMETRRRGLEKNEEKPETDFDAIFQKELKRVRKENNND